MHNNKENHWVRNKHVLYREGTLALLWQKSLCRKTSLIRPHGGHGACSPMRPLNHKTGTTGVPCSGPVMHGHGVTNAKLLLLNLLLDQLPKGLHRLAWICVTSDVVVGTFQEVSLILALVLCGVPYLCFELEQRSSFCCFCRLLQDIFLALELLVEIRQGLCPLLLKCLHVLQHGQQRNMK